MPFQGKPLGQHTFHVELILKTGEPVFDKDAGQTLFSEVTLDVKAPGGCGGSVSDGGGDDASDATIDAPVADAPVTDVSPDVTPDVTEAGDAPGDAPDESSDAGGDAAADATGE